MFFLTEPQVGLQRIGNSQFYATPNTPADPRDCNRFPNSPWCGGWGFSKEAVDSGLEFVVDECNLGVSFSPTLAYVNFPTFQIVLRRDGEACRLPTPPPPSREAEPFEESPRIPNGEGIILGYQSYWINSVDGFDNIQSAREIRVSLISQQEIDFRINPVKVTNYSFADWKFTFQYAISEAFNGSWFARNYESDIEFIRYAANKYREAGGVISGNPEDEESSWSLEVQGTVECYTLALYASGDNQKLIISENLKKAGINIGSIVTRQVDPNKKNFLRKIKDSRLAIQRDINKFPISIPSWFEPRIVDIKGTESDLYGVYYTYDSYSLIVQGESTSYFKVGQKLAPPPPPPPKKKECCMCCPSQAADLALLIRLQKIQLKRTGDFPATVPIMLNTGTSKNDTMQIQSIGEMIAWLARNLDAMIGEFPLSIKIEDSDLTAEGNQSITVSSPNIAETMLEQLGLMLAMKTEVQALLKTCINTLVEAGSIRQTTAINHDYLDAIAEYLGFKITQIEKDISLTFSPGEENLDKMLTGKTRKYVTVENTDKKDINDSLSVMLEMAARWNAQNFRNLGLSNTKENLKDLLRTSTSVGKYANDFINLDKVRNAKENEPIDLIPESTFDRFLEDSETQFQSTLGATDITDPWGMPYENRPKITQIGKTEQGDK